MRVLTKWTVILEKFVIGTLSKKFIHNINPGCHFHKVIVGIIFLVIFLGRR
jgi:hypothetical protein